jgi:tripartite-type tricarboxylate transporter receptor subunit TctC
MNPAGSRPRRPNRRATLTTLATTIAAPLVLGSAARAQAAWPNRPVRYVNPFPAGGPTDTLSRLFCIAMSEATGQQFVVENKGGGGGDIGVDSVAKAEPDGYTLGLGGIASHAISPTLKAGKLMFDPAKDFSFLTHIWSLPNFLIGNLQMPAQTVPELIELLRKNPRKYNYGSAGAGTTLHLSGEMFKLMADVDIVHVPYRGSALAMTDLLGGQVQLMFDNLPSALAQHKAGKVRGYGVTSAARSLVLPDMPALVEFVPGFDIKSWTALIGPAKLPAAVVERISMFSKKVLEGAALTQAFFERGATAWWSSPQEVTAYRASEEKRLGDIIRKAKITLD